MISDIGRSKRDARAISAASVGREVARVVEAGLRVDARLGLQLRNAERAVDDEERRERGEDQPRVPVPERCERDAEDRRARASTESASTLKRPDSRNVCPRPSLRIIATRTWLASDERDARRRGRRARSARRSSGSSRSRDGGRGRRPPRRERVRACSSQMLKPWIGHGVRSFSHSGIVCTSGMSTSSSGGSSSAAATRNTTEVWYMRVRAAT